MDPLPVDVAIDLAFVPRRRPGLATVTAGSEALIVDDRAALPHLLSPTAALVWSFVDGVGSLGDFATDLCEVLGTDRREIERDLVELTRELVERGLLADASGSLRTEVDPPEPGRRRLGAPINVALDARFDGAEARVVLVRDGSIELEIRTDDAGLADDVVEQLTCRGIEVGSPRPVQDPSHPDSGPERQPGGPAPLYAVLLGRPKGPVTGLHLLYRSGRPLRRCRHRLDMVRIVGADVAAVLGREAHGQPLLDVVGLTSDDRLLAIDPIFSSIIDTMEPGLRRAGIERLDASLVTPLAADARFELAGLALRPGPGPGQTPAAVALTASDLARGLDTRIGPASLAQLCDVVAAAAVVRVPGRDGLHTAIRELLN